MKGFNFQPLINVLEMPLQVFIMTQNMFGQRWEKRNHNSCLVGPEDEVNITCWASLWILVKTNFTKYEKSPLLRTDEEAIC